MLADGRIAVVYRSETAEGSNDFDLRYVILDPRGPIIEGSDNADTIFGGAGDSTVHGYGGGDALQGMAEDDALHGEGGMDTVRGGFGDDTVRGGSDADVLDGERHDDVIHGNSGDDVLAGGLGRDILHGGSGLDTFDFDATRESPRPNGADTIADFIEGEDVIDLRTIDASLSAGRNQAFAFIGDAAFTAEGQVRVVAQGGDTLVLVNTSGASGAEMAIRLSGSVALQAGDFIL